MTVRPCGAGTISPLHKCLEKGTMLEIRTIRKKAKQKGTRKGDTLWGRIGTARQLNQRKQNEGCDGRRTRRTM